MSKVQRRWPLPLLALGVGAAWERVGLGVCWALALRGHSERGADCCPSSQL